MATSSLVDAFNFFFLQSFKRSNRIILIILLFISAGLGFLIPYTSDNIYSSEFTAESPYIKNEIIVNMLNDIQNFIVAEEYQYVMKKLDLPLKTAKLLCTVKAEKIGENENGLKIRTNRFTINIHTRTDDIRIIDSILTGLLNMIRNNPYIKNQINVERKSIITFNEKIGKKIEELESLQEENLKQMERGENPFSYYNYLVNLYEKKNNLDNQLQKTAVLEVIDEDPYPLRLDPEYWNSIYRYIMITIVLWFAFNLFVSLTKAIDKSIS